MTDAPRPEEKGDYTFGQIAIKENLCTFEQVKECLDLQAKLRSLGMQPKKIGDILLEKGYLTPEQAIQIAKLQIQSSSLARITIPGYEIIAKIGQGGMGAVYKARQVSMDRIVAIKVLSPKYAKDTAFVERFVREARAVAKLNHENVIGGIDVGEVHDIHYFVMEYVEGTPLISILKREGKIEEQRCLTIGLHIARALAHAHKYGIVHRDVKPENVIMTIDHVAKLCDLGIAKNIRGQGDPSAAGMSLGTPVYISPEQARGEPSIDHRTDIYSLGATLYHMATGTTPFSGPSSMVIMTKHVTEPLEPPRKRNPFLTEGFENLVLKMMQKRREDRHQDPASLMTDIQNLLGNGAAPATALPKPPSTSRKPAQPGFRSKTEVGAHPLPKKTFPVVPIVVAAGAVLAIGVGFIFLRSKGGPPNVPATVEHIPSVNPRNDVSPSEADRLGKELEDFRSLVNTQMASSAADRFTQPYLQIHRQIDRYKGQSDFAAQQAWMEELERHTRKVNALINEKVWEEIRKKAKEHFDAGRYTKALGELDRFDVVYRWFRNDDKPEMTEAGRAYQDLRDSIVGQLNETYITEKRKANEAFRDPARREEAYRTLDTLADSGTAEQKLDVARTREDFFKKEVETLLGAAPASDQYKMAQERIRDIKALHVGNSDAAALLEGMSRELQARQQQALADAAARVSAVYQGEFQPKFEEALRKRDLADARRELHRLCFAPEYALFQSTLLSSLSDAALLKAYLDPLRAGFPDVKRVVVMADEGFRIAQKQGSIPAARALCLDLRLAALLEDLMDQAIEGAKLANRDPNRFKSGYSPALKDAFSAEPHPRKPGDPRVALDVTFKSSSTVIVAASLTPKAAPALTEDDIVALACRSYSPGADFAAKADQDPFHALKSFLLYYYAGNLTAAKSMWEKLPAAGAQPGLERYGEAMKGVSSRREEDAAEKLYREAYALWDQSFKRSDKGAEASALKKFRECIERYSHTDYMKKPVPTADNKQGRSRIETVQVRILGPAGGGNAPVDPKRAEKVKGLEYKYYEGKWDKLPNLDALTPVKAGNVEDFDLSIRVRGDFFAVVFSGFLEILRDGAYVFYLSSDDGSKVRLNGAELIDNDGVHPKTEKAARINLKAGMQEMAVLFFNAGGDPALDLFYEGPNLPRQRVPASALYRLKR